MAWLWRRSPPLQDQRPLTPGGPAASTGLLKQVVVWRRVKPSRAVRYICFENLTTNRFMVQSGQYYDQPVEQERIQRHDASFIELLIESEPGGPGLWHQTLEAAIRHFDAKFQ